MTSRYIKLQPRGGWELIAGNQFLVGVSSIQVACFNFAIPDDWNGLDEAIIIYYHGGNENNIRLDMWGTYGADGEQYNNHAETDNLTRNYVATQLEEIDVSGVLTNLAGGDVGSIQIDHNASYTNSGRALIGWLLET